MRRRRLRSRVRLWFKRRSNRRKILFFIRFFTVIVLSLCVVWLVLHLPFLTVRSVSVSDQGSADQELRSDVLVYADTLLQERAYGLSGKTRYFFQRDEFVKMLRSRFLRARDIVLRTGFWGAWEVEVAQRETFGTFCVDEYCLLIDAAGFVFMETTMHIGSDIRMFDGVSLGEYVFGADEEAVRDFSTISAVVLFLREKELPVSYISLQPDTRVVHLHLENGIGIWFDSSGALYETTRALHIVFEEIFSDAVAQAGIISVDVRNPVSIVYERR